MLSIIICTLNEEFYLPRLVNNVLDQKCLNIEIIIVDGGSLDATIAIGEELAINNRNIKFVHGPRGIALQRNMGAEVAKNDRLLFLDADVFLPENFLSNLMKEVTANKILVAGTRIYAIENKWKYRAIFWLYSHVYLPIARLGNPIIHGCSIYSSKSIHQEIGGFQEDVMFEDYLYGKMAAEIYRPPLLKSTYVKTSARRFYDGSWKQIFELVRGGFLTLFIVGLPTRLFKAYSRKTGNHGSLTN